MKDKPLHPEKARDPIYSTLSGIVILIKLEQSLNASVPIDVTPSAIVILVKLVQFEKADSLIEVNVL